MFRAENVATSVAKARELRDYCGLPAHELVAFRPERLIVHELLVRVTSDLHVPDGTDYEDLGRNFRRIASTILDQHITPHRAQLTELLERLRSSALALIAQEVETYLSRRPPPATHADREARGRWPFQFGKPKKQPLLPAESAEQRERRIVSEWSKKAERSDDRLKEACFHALSRIATAIMARRGRLLVSKDLLSELAVTLVCNDHGSVFICEAIEPLFQLLFLLEG